MSLLTIPNEILMQIVHELDEQGLNALLQTNRSLYEAFNDYLYESHVEKYGGIALLWAAIKGRVDTAKRLLDLGVDPNTSLREAKDSGCHMLESGRLAKLDDWLVVQRISGYLGDPRIMIPKSLVQRWCEERWCWGHEKFFQAPLLCAIKGAHADVVELLLSQPGIDRKCRDENLHNTLQIAAAKGHVGIMKMLLAKGLWGITEKCGQSYSYHRTPLFQAVSCGHEGIFDLILQQDVCHWEEDEILRYARRRGGNMLKSLLGYAQCSRFRITDPNAGLADAAQAGDAIGLEILLTQPGVDPGWTRYSGDPTPFELAAKYGQVNIMQILLATGKVDVNSRDSDGNTPLFHAASNGHENVVDFLLSQPGISQYARNYDNKMAAHFALEAGKKDLCRRLKEDIQLEPGFECLLR
ncbi:hypothetical protein MW887_005657 [Aspergillus wentii]|nr:hypothetical protein MW887_005657 [Aspergillus wentii]